MASRSQLETLIDLARRETDAAAKRLGVALKAVSDAEQQHQMLVGYREDYAQRLQTRMGEGMTPMAFRNYQAFLDKLDTAIAGQADAVKQAQRRSEHEKNVWQDAERKRMSYTTLEARAEQEAMKLEAKRDQKAMDEHATRQAYYKR